MATVSAAIRAVLQMMEPMALPNAMAPWLWTAAVTETMTSGRVVPMDTTVAPMTISGSRNRFAMPTAPSRTSRPP